MPLVERDLATAICDEQAAANPDPESALVVVYVDAAVVDGKVDGNGQIEGLEVAAESVLRLLCDAKVEFAIDSPDRTTIGIRSVAPAASCPPGCEDGSADATAAVAASRAVSGAYATSTTPSTGSATAARR